MGGGIATFIILVMILAINNAIRQNQSSNSSSTNIDMSYFTRQANKLKASDYVNQYKNMSSAQLPEKIDDSTTLNDVTADDSTSSITYHYSVSDNVENLTSAKIAQTKTMTDETCKDSGLKNILNDDITINFEYTFQNGQQMTIPITRC